MKVMSLNGSVNSDFYLDQDSDISDLLLECQKNWGDGFLLSDIIRGELSDGGDVLYIVFSDDYEIELKYLNHNKDLKLRNLPVGEGFCSPKKIINFYFSHVQEQLDEMNKCIFLNSNPHNNREIYGTVIFCGTTIGVVSASVIHGPMGFGYLFGYSIAGFFTGCCVNSLCDVFCFEPVINKLQSKMKKRFYKLKINSFNYLVQLKEVLGMYYIDNSIDVVHKEDLIKFNELLGFYKKIVDRKSLGCFSDLPDLPDLPDCIETNENNHDSLSIEEGLSPEFIINVGDISDCYDSDSDNNLDDLAMMSN